MLAHKIPLQGGTCDGKASKGLDVKLEECHIIPKSSNRVGLQAHNITKCAKRSIINVTSCLPRGTLGHRRVTPSFRVPSIVQVLMSPSQVQRLSSKASNEWGATSNQFAFNSLWRSKWLISSMNGFHRARSCKDKQVRPPRVYKSHVSCEVSHI
jgi:hypothetical protein